MDLPSAPDLVGCRPSVNTIGGEIYLVLVEYRAIVIYCVGVCKYIAWACANILRGRVQIYCAGVCKYIV